MRDYQVLIVTDPDSKVEDIKTTLKNIEIEKIESVYTTNGRLEEPIPDDYDLAVLYCNNPEIEYALDLCDSI